MVKLLEDQKLILWVGLDIDKKDYNYQEIRTNMPELSYLVYETRKGYHIFLTNKYYDYKDNDTIDLMIKLGADFYNIVFCNLRGFLCPRPSCAEVAVWPNWKMWSETDQRM